MSRGGYRPGSGRPRKNPIDAPKLNSSANAISKCVMAELKASNMTPLEYMLKVMNDLTVDDPRRDRMAIAAAPYCHHKVAEARTGKKDIAADNAATAGIGTSWSGDLEFEQVN